MNKIAYQDKLHTIVINDTYDGVRVQVFHTVFINETTQYHNTSFETYRVSPPGKLDRMLYGTYESQIKSAVDSLIKDIKKTNDKDANKVVKVKKVFECTKKTLIAMYGE